MKKLYVLPSFERAVKKLTPRQKDELAKGLEDFNRYMGTGVEPAGFGLRKISPHNYEFRLDIRLRVIIRVDKEAYYLVLVGDHNEVLRYLREYR